MRTDDAPHRACSRRIAVWAVKYERYTTDAMPELAVDIQCESCATTASVESSCKGRSDCSAKVVRLERFVFEQQIDHQRMHPVAAFSVEAQDRARFQKGV